MMQSIKDIVLIGTDRKPLDTAVLPATIKTALNAGTTEEQKLLDAITYLHFYERHGNTSSNYIDSPSKPVDETQEDTPEEANIALEEILKLDYLLKNSMLKDIVRSRKLRIVHAIHDQEGDI